VNAPRPKGRGFYRFCEEIASQSQNVDRCISSLLDKFYVILINLEKNATELFAARQDLLHQIVLTSSHHRRWCLESEDF
jgi:hypothetical protein